MFCSSGLQSGSGCFVHLTQRCCHLKKLFLTANRSFMTQSFLLSSRKCFHDHLLVLLTTLWCKGNTARSYTVEALVCSVVDHSLQYTAMHVDLLVRVLNHKQPNWWLRWCIRFYLYCNWVTFVKKNSCCWCVCFRTICDTDLEAVASCCTLMEQLDILGTREVSPTAVQRYTLLLYNYLCIRAARWHECVYVLQRVFLFFVFFTFCFFRLPQRWCINMRQPFSGTAERIFMKLLPNDSGEKCNFQRHTQMGARPPE